MIPFDFKPIPRSYTKETLLEGVARRAKLLSYETKLIRKHDGRQALLVVEPPRKPSKPKHGTMRGFKAGEKAK